MTVLVPEYSSRSKIVAVALTLALAFVLALALALILRPDTYAVPRNDPWMQMKDDSRLRLKSFNHSTVEVEFCLFRQHLNP